MQFSWVVVFLVKVIIAGLLRSDAYAPSVFYTVGKNFPEMKLVILMNKFIRIQICINGFRQVNVFNLFFYIEDKRYIST